MKNYVSCKFSLCDILIYSHVIFLFSHMIFLLMEEFKVPIHNAVVKFFILMLEVP